MALIAFSSVWMILGVVALSGAQAISASTCDSNAVCVGYYSGFNCSCNSGYKGSNGGCININECVETPEVCTKPETCNDIIGSYNCTCGDVDTICHDVAECVDECVNGTNSTHCVCNTGYTGNGTYCSDINECVVESDLCHDDADCNNTVGSYSCACHEGFEGNGFICNDVNECERELHDCELPLTCNNTKGSFDCICGNKRSCHDNAFCTRLLNNLTVCACNPGYFGNGESCVDEDECKKDEHDCHSNASCKNTVGSFRCICKEGYSGDGKECNTGNVLSISVGLLVLGFTTSLLTFTSS